jgi:hypothetical protein
MASFIADDLTYHDDQVPGVGLSSWDYPCPLNEGFRLCVCVCEEQGPAAHYSSNLLAMTRCSDWSVAMTADPHPVRVR